MHIKFNIPEGRFAVIRVHRTDGDKDKYFRDYASKQGAKRAAERECSKSENRHYCLNVYNHEGFHCP